MDSKATEIFSEKYMPVRIPFFVKMFFEMLYDLNRNRDQSIEIICKTYLLSFFVSIVH